MKNKLDLNKLHMTLLYLKMNKKFRKRFLDLDKLEDFCESKLKKYTLTPISSKEAIKPLNDVFAIIYNSSFEFNNTIRSIQNYIINTITRKLERSKIPYTIKNKCEKDGGVWLYIDIVENKYIYSIIKMRVDPLLPHISFSIYSLSSKDNPITVHDIRKVYRNKYLRSEIEYSKIKLKNGEIEFI
tara:strand:- start:1995 stop:2549 length:555 start_codon:yes stop_codon:yes gene_type:complete